MGVPAAFGVLPALAPPFGLAGGLSTAASALPKLNQLLDDGLGGGEALLGDGGADLLALGVLGLEPAFEAGLGGEVLLPEEAALGEDPGLAAALALGLGGGPAISNGAGGGGDDPAGVLVVVAAEVTASPSGLTTAGLTATTPAPSANVTSLGVASTFETLTSEASTASVSPPSTTSGGTCTSEASFGSTPSGAIGAATSA